MEEEEEEEEEEETTSDEKLSLTLFVFRWPGDAAGNRVCRLDIT